MTVKAISMLLFWCIDFSSHSDAWCSANVSVIIETGDTTPVNTAARNDELWFTLKVLDRQIYLLWFKLIVSHIKHVVFRTLCLCCAGLWLQVFTEVKWHVQWFGEWTEVKAVQCYTARKPSNFSFMWDPGKLLETRDVTLAVDCSSQTAESVWPGDSLD